MHQKQDMWAGTSLTVCCLSWPRLWWASSIGKRSLSDPIRGERLCLCGPFCNLCALWTTPCTGDLLRDVLGPNMSQAGLLQMKPCWQKGLAATEREKQEVIFFKDDRGTKFWLFIGQEDSQGFVLLEILYPRKLAAISAWCCQTVLQNLRFHMKEGGKSKTNRKPSIPCSCRENTQKLTVTRVVFLSWVSNQLEAIPLRRANCAGHFNACEVWSLTCLHSS